MSRGRRVLRSSLFWLLVLFIVLLVALPHSEALWASLFPALDRPLYHQDSFAALALVHMLLVLVSSLLAAIIGIGVGIAVTRPGGREFRPLAETLAAVGQTFPPVAVLAVAVPVLGFGQTPALIALVLYGLLPILQGTLAGMAAVPDNAREVANGVGMSHWQRLWQVELPLAAPVILAGVRTSVIINIGTAAIASTVGVRSLGTPIIIGLSGFNSAWVIQGAVTVALMAVVVDSAFAHLQRRVTPYAR